MEWSDPGLISKYYSYIYLEKTEESSKSQDNLCPCWDSAPLPNLQIGQN
jgi:hypothetical protein